MPNKGISQDLHNENSSVTGYRTLFDRYSINHSKSGLQITRDMYIDGCFKPLLNFTYDRADLEGHSSHPVNGYIRYELKFNLPLPEAITCLLYIQYDNSFLLGFSLKFRPTFKMDTMKILCTLPDVTSFFSVFPPISYNHHIRSQIPATTSSMTILKRGRFTQARHTT